MDLTLSLQHVGPEHPPDKKQRDDGEKDVADPLARGFRLAEFEHPASLANVCEKRRGAERH